MKKITWNLKKYSTIGRFNAALKRFREDKRGYILRDINEDALTFCWAYEPVKSRVTPGPIYSISDRDKTILSALDSIDNESISLCISSVRSVFPYNRGEWGSKIYISGSLLLFDVEFESKDSFSIYRFRFQNRLGDPIGCFPFKVTYSVHEFIPESDDFIDHHEIIFENSFSYDDTDDVNPTTFKLDLKKVMGDSV